LFLKQSDVRTVKAENWSGWEYNSDYVWFYLFSSKLTFLWLIHAGSMLVNIQPTTIALSHSTWATARRVGLPP